MLKDDPNYAKVQSCATSNNGFVHYWLGPDHLLLVEVSGYVERYRRFYYRDIQALQVRQTMTLALGNVALIGAGILFLVIGIAINDPVGLGIFAGIAFVLVILAVVNSVRGETCAFHVRTALQTEALPGVGRMSQAHRLCAALKLRIEAVQGAMPAAEIVALQQESLAAAAATPAAVSQAPPVRLAHCHGGAHSVLFALCLAETAALVVDLIADNDTTGAIAVMIMIPVAIAGIVSLVKQARTDLPGELRKSTWICTLLYPAMMAVAIAYTIVLEMQGRDMEAEMHYSNPLLLVITVLVAAAGGLIAGLSLRRLYAFRRATETPPPMMDAPPPEQV